MLISTTLFKRQYIQLKQKPIALYHFTVLNKINKRNTNEIQEGTVLALDDIDFIGGKELPLTYSSNHQQIINELKENNRYLDYLVKSAKQTEEMNKKTIAWFIGFIIGTCISMFVIIYDDEIREYYRKWVKTSHNRQ